MDLPRPDSYSTVIPSFAISAALTCSSTESRKLFEDCRFDHALATFVSFVFMAFSNNNFFLFFKFLLLLSDAIFLPPLKRGHEIVAFKVSLSLSLIVELVSSVFELLKDRVAEGERSDLAIVTSFSDCS